MDKKTLFITDQVITVGTNGVLDSVNMILQWGYLTAMRGCGMMLGNCCLGPSLCLKVKL